MQRGPAGSAGLPVSAGTGRTLFLGLLDNSRIHQLADCQLADWTTRGLDKSRTGQFADATGDFACLVFIFWPFTDVLLGVYLNIYYTYVIPLVALCPHSPIMQLKLQILLLVASASCPVREMSSPRVGNPRVGGSASCPVTFLGSVRSVTRQTGQTTTRGTRFCSPA